MTRRKEKKKKKKKKQLPNSTNKTNFRGNVSIWRYFYKENVVFFRGGSRIFIWGGGGGAKDYVRERTLGARNTKSLSAGVQGPLKGRGSNRDF